MPDPTRIKDIPENELTAEQARVFKDLVAGRGRLLTPYRIWIHSPKLAAALETIGTFLNKRSSLTEREVELVICIIANHWKGEYVWTVHVRTCVQLGFPQSAFDAIRAGQDPLLDDERERAVYELTKIAMAPGAGSDEVFDRAERVLGRNGIAEVLALLGYYSAVAMAVKLHRVPVAA
jgi:4-carboxymuconolactone decarboxylase